MERSPATYRSARLPRRGPRSRRSTRTWRLAVASGLTALVTACSAGPGSISTAPTSPAYTLPPRTMSLTSPAFTDGGVVPATFTCAGEGQSPPLDVGNVPAGTRALALIIADPDAPSGTYYHWLVFNIPPGTTHIPADSVPTGARQGIGSSGDPGYDPLCPPSGTHTYTFSVYALDTVFTLPDNSDVRTVLDAVRQAATARGEITGTVTATPSGSAPS